MSPEQHELEQSQAFTYYFVPAFLNSVGMGVCRSNTGTPGSGTAPWACNPKPLNSSLHLLNKTISLQLFLEKLKGEEKAVNLSNHDSIRGHLFLKLLYFSQRFLCSRSLGIANYQSRAGGSVTDLLCKLGKKMGLSPLHWLRVKYVLWRGLKLNIGLVKCS